MIHLLLWSFVFLVIGTASVWQMDPTPLREVLAMTLAFCYMVWVLLIVTIRSNKDETL